MNIFTCYSFLPIDMKTVVNTIKKAQAELSHEISILLLYKHIHILLFFVNEHIYICYVQLITCIFQKTRET